MLKVEGFFRKGWRLPYGMVDSRWVPRKEMPCAWSLQDETGRSVGRQLAGEMSADDIQGAGFFFAAKIHRRGPMKMARQSDDHIAVGAGLIP